MPGPIWMRPQVKAVTQNFLPLWFGGSKSHHCFFIVWFLIVLKGRATLIRTKESCNTVGRRQHRFPPTSARGPPWGSRTMGTSYRSKYQSRSWGKAKSAKFLPGKPGDQSSVPRPGVKSQAGRQMLVSQQRQVDPWGALARQSSQIDEVLDQWETLSPKVGWKGGARAQWESTCLSCMKS